MFPLSVVCYCIFHFPPIFVTSSGFDQVWVFLVTPQIYLRYYYHYLVVVAGGTAVHSVGSFVTYNNGILVVMGVCIGDVTVVIVAVFAVIVGVS